MSSRSVVVQCKKVNAMSVVPELEGVAIDYVMTISLPEKWMEPPVQRGQPLYSAKN